VLNDVAKPYLGVGMKRWGRHQRDALSNPEQEPEMLIYESSDFTNDFLDRLLPLGLVIVFGMASAWSSPLLSLQTLVQVRSNPFSLSTSTDGLVTRSEHIHTFLVSAVRDQLKHFPSSL
jgi:hypothetical protein